MKRTNYSIRICDRAKGSYLIEALVACLISGMIATSLVQSYAQLSQVAVHSQSELDAIAVAQECIDQLRSQQFTFIMNNLGTHNVTVVGTAPTGDVVFPRPLLRDTSLTYYNDVASQTTDLYNYLHATNNQAVVTLTQASSDSINVVVVVTWRDSQPGLHTYTVQTVLASTGLNG